MKDLVIKPNQITRGTTTLHYWLAGPTDHPLVVFTHGGGMDHRMFEAQLAFVAKNYRVLLWDVHGHGQSQPMGMEGIFSLRTVVDDLLVIVDQLGYQQASFVGQSLGASISQELAFVYPERVTSLVVIGGTCLTMGITRQRAFKLRMQAQLESFLPSSVLNQFIVNIVGIRPEVKAYAQEAYTHIARETALAVARALPGFFHEEVDYRLQMPFLLTHGAQDAVKRVIQQAPIWAQHEPNCRYIVIPQAGHNANQDNPDFFNSTLLDFLSQHIPVGTKE